MRRPAEILAAAVVLAAVTGCAAQKAAHSAAREEDAPPARLASPTGKCIFLDTINDWKAVDPYHLLVRTRATGWQWRVTLDRRCSEMLYANALTWDTIDTRVCDSRRDRRAAQPMPDRLDRAVRAATPGSEGAAGRRLVTSTVGR